MASCVVPLDKTHDVKSFECASPELTQWLQTIARQHQEKSLSKTFVLVDDNSPETIIGFYALAIRGIVTRETLPPALAKKFPSKVPGFTIARLAITSGASGQGLGGELLVDAMRRAKQVSEQAGGPFLFVDAKDEEAAAFYKHFGFVPLPDDPLTLVIPMSII